MNILFFTSEYFHPSRDFRFTYIKQVCESIAKINASKKLIFHCNEIDDSYIQRISQYIGNINLEIEFIKVPIHGPELSWEHKKYLNYFLQSNFDYFIYIENDLLFKQENLDYWIENKDIIKKFGLNFIPSFLRFEVDNNNNVMALDCTLPIDCKSRPIIELNRKRFVSHPEPYHGLFILDKLDAYEHKNSKNLTLENYTKNVTHRLKWGEIESANSALLIENIPIGFDHRGVLVLDDISRCLIHHLPNKFVNTHNYYGFGQLPLKDLFIL